MLVAGDTTVPAGVLATLHLTLATHTLASNMLDVLLSALTELSDATTSPPAGIPPIAIAGPPVCPKCGQFTVSIGKLPEFGLHRLVYVYKCQPCREIVAIHPKKQGVLRPAKQLSAYFDLCSIRVTKRSLVHSSIALASVRHLAVTIASSSFAQISALYPSKLPLGRTA